MAINRITGPNSLPLTTDDYQAQNNLMNKIINGIHASPFLGTNMSINSLFFVGGTLYSVDTATAITGTESMFVAVTPFGDGSTATANFIANINGVTWSDIYSGYYSGSSRIFISYHYNRKIILGPGPIIFQFAPPANFNKILVTAVANGGDGSAGVTDVRPGAGGGAGAWCRDLSIPVTRSVYDITLSTTESTTIIGAGVNLVLGKGQNASASTAGAGGIGSGGGSNGFAGGGGGPGRGYFGGSGGGTGGHGVFGPSSSTPSANSRGGGTLSASDYRNGIGYGSGYLSGSSGDSSATIIPVKSGIGAGGCGGHTDNGYSGTPNRLNGGTSIAGGGGGGGGTQYAGAPNPPGSGGAGGPPYMVIEW